MSPNSSLIWSLSFSALLVANFNLELNVIPNSLPNLRNSSLSCNCIFIFGLGLPSITNSSCSSSLTISTNLAYVWQYKPSVVISNSQIMSIFSNNATNLLNSCFATRSFNQLGAFIFLSSILIKLSSYFFVLFVL